MSADNGIFYRQVDGVWYVMLGFASDEHDDDDYRERGDGYDSLAKCLLRAHRMASEESTEYGIIHDR